MILFNRVDSKLIRCAKNISALQSIDRCVAVDDKAAADPVIGQLEVMAAPVGCVGRLYSEADAPTHLKKSAKNLYKTVVVAKSPVTFLRLFQEVEELPKLLNLAKEPKQEDVEAIRAINAIADMGIEVYVQDFLNNPKVPWEKIRDRY